MGPGTMGHWSGSLIWLLNSLMDAVRRYFYLQPRKYLAPGALDLSGEHRVLMVGTTQRAPKSGALS